MNKTMHSKFYIKYKDIKKMIYQGFSKQQAVALAHLVKQNNFYHSHCLKRTDLENLKNQITKLCNDFEKLELRMIIKLGSLIAIAVSLLASINKIF